MGNTLFKKKKKPADVTISQKESVAETTTTERISKEDPVTNRDERDSSFAQSQEEELPGEVQIAFSSAYNKHADEVGEALSAKDVHRVFLHAIELLEWDSDKGMAVAYFEVCDGMKKCIGARGKLRGEDAFFRLLKEVALAPKNSPPAKLPQEEPAKKIQQEPEPNPAPKVNNSKFEFTGKAEAKAIGDGQGIMWQEWWKRKVPLQGKGKKIAVLPGMAYAFENKSPTVLKIIIDFSQSKNFIITEPPVRSVSRNGNTITKIVKPGACDFVAMISQTEPGQSLSIAPNIKFTQVFDNQVYM